MGVRCPLPVALHLGSGVLVAGDLNTILFHGPVEESGQYLPITVGGLGCKGLPPYPGCNELRNISRGDLLETVNIDVLRCVSARTFFAIDAYFGVFKG